MHTPAPNVQPLKTDPGRIRPEDTMTAHTGYLIFAAKASPLPEPAEITEECENGNE